MRLLPGFTIKRETGIPVAQCQCQSQWQWQCQRGPATLSNRRAQQQACRPRPAQPPTLSAPQIEPHAMLNSGLQLCPCSDNLHFKAPGIAGRVKSVKMIVNTSKQTIITCLVQHLSQIPVGASMFTRLLLGVCALALGVRAQRLSSGSTHAQ